MSQESAKGESVLDCVGLNKWFGEFQAVRNFDLRVPKGSICGFLGQNGAGKTTTIRMILDIIKPTSGTIRILGAPTAFDVRRRIGYLPEEKGLYRTMKASAFIAYFASLKGMGRAEARTVAVELLKKYGLGDSVNQKLAALSKGMGQKVQMLAAIAHDPEFVILDEPFSGLDPVNQEVMEAIIRDMAQRGRTIIFSTHVMPHAERLCDRIVLIAKGAKILDGTMAEARRAVPRCVRIETADPVDSLKSNPAVLEVRPKLADGARVESRYELLLRDGADPQGLLRDCFEHGIRLTQFDAAEPTLHEIFVQLVQRHSLENAA